MSQTVKILWVHDDFNGPVNGLALYKGEKVWFTRKNFDKEFETPVIVSSTDIPVPQINNLDRTYSLLRLEPDVLKMVEDNHVEYCNKTSAPFNHGDPYKIRPIDIKVRADFSKRIPEGQDYIDLTNKSMINVIVFNHSYDPNALVGECIETINESEFINYLVPRRIL